MILAFVLISVYALLATLAIVLIVKKMRNHVVSLFDYNNIVQKKTSTLYFDVNGVLISDNDSTNSEHFLGSLRTGDNISEYKDNPDMATYLRTCARHRGNLTYKVEEKVENNLVRRIDLIFSPFISSGELRGVSVVSQIMYSKNREAELVEKARGLFSKLQKRWYTAYDETGAVGRRYRRMDEIGTPWCITVDFDSLENNTYTLRDRDTTQQTRLSEAELTAFFEKELQ